MISFDEFKPIDGSPIYQQIISVIKRGIVGETIVDGDELPSRRVLSATLGINPNTVQKAFKSLEDEGLIESKTGAKSNVVVNEKVKRRLKTELLADDIKAVITSLKMMNISKDEALELIEKNWGVD